MNNGIKGYFLLPTLKQWNNSIKWSIYVKFSILNFYSIYTMGVKKGILKK